MSNRYYVATTHGYRGIGVGRTSEPPGLEAMVIDRLNCHRVVASYSSHIRPLGKLHALGNALHHAQQLNGQVLY